MKNISLIVFLFFTTSLLAQSSQLNKIDNQGKKQGAWKKYDHNTLVYEGNFLDDVPTGEFKYYYKNGNLKSISNFLNGPSKVKTIIFHENGEKASEGMFIDQLKDGIWNYYTPQKILIKIEAYKLGKKEGTWKIFSSQDGTLLEEDHYAQDMLHGSCTTYYLNKELCSVSNYIDGKLNGVYESYYMGHIPAAKGLYHNNLKTGMWDFFDEQGNIRKSIDYSGRELKTFVYIYNGKNAQKINQDLIAYYQKTGDQIVITLFNGTTMIATESWETLMEHIDFMSFCKVTPHLIASINAIVKYEEMGDDTIVVTLKPTLNYEVISQGDEAKFVKSFFKRELPKQ
ncbi:MAG: hypothetical protein RR034_06835 [Bacteroidales bacterium]